MKYKGTSEVLDLVLIDRRVLLRRSRSFSFAQPPNPGSSQLYYLEKRTKVKGQIIEDISDRPSIQHENLIQEENLE